MANKNTQTSRSSSPTHEESGTLSPLSPCRIAVYDNPAATPQIIEIAPQPISSYMDAIAQEVIDVLRGFRSSIPYMVVRECVENLIHAAFKNPTISILHEGMLVRFSDQGPGISHKEAALEFGTSTATDEMRKYIRGVGSGLPVAYQYMQDRGGSLVIEDNLNQGCVITISLTEEQGVPAQTTASQPSSSERSVSQHLSQSIAAPMQEAAGSPRKSNPALSVSQPSSAKKSRTSQEKYGEEVETLSPALLLQEKEKLALLLCLTREKIGPTDLLRLFGHSLSTWSRTLQYLVGLGLMSKPAHQQKYHLSPKGKEVATHNI